MDVPTPLSPTPQAPSFDSIIVPPEPPPVPPQAPEEKKPVPAPTAPSGGNGSVFKKKSNAGPILATLILLLITLPLSIIFIVNRNQSADVRSRASSLYPTCPSAGGACLAPYKVGDQCYAGSGPEGDKGYYCCVQNPSGTKTWEPKGSAACPTGVPDCPLTWNWNPNTRQCCPSAVDACDYNSTEQKCINDPFISHCEKWGDGTCPGGGGRWAGGNYYTDCMNEGCGNTGYICVQGAMHDADGKSYNLCRNPDCPQDPDCICEGTPPPTSPPSGGQCDDIQILKGETVVTDFSTIVAGDVISIEVKGVGATNGRIRINGADWVESTLTKDVVGGVSAQWFVVPNVTIPSGVTSITIESEVYVDSVWK